MLSVCSRIEIGVRNSSNSKTLGFPLTPEDLWITITDSARIDSNQSEVLQKTHQDKQLRHSHLQRLDAEITIRGDANNSLSESFLAIAFRHSRGVKS